MEHGAAVAKEATRIVLIEDDARVREACAELLVSNGYSVTAADRGVEGVRLACRDRPHLIVTDIVLPDLDGRDLVRILHAHTPTRHIPIIAATAERSIPGPRDAGLFVAVLHKPFTAGNLLSVVDRYSRAAATDGAG